MSKLFILLFFYYAPSLANETKKILIVEDTESIKTVLEKFLKEENFVVQSATNVERAILDWYIFSPDLVILDMGLPLYPNGKIFHEGGLTILKLTPLDKAKVILSSNRNIQTFPPVLSNLIDYNFNGKFIPYRHFPILEELINTETQPKRISSLYQLEQKQEDKEAEIRNSINALLLLRQEQVGSLKSKDKQKIKEKTLLATKRMRRELLKFQQIQKSMNNQECMRIF